MNDSFFATNKANGEVLTHGPVPVALILASQSPRRRELLQEAGYSFVVIPPDDSAEEEKTNIRALPLDGRAEVLLRATLKAQNVMQKLFRRPGHSISPQVIVACDSIAVCRQEILGKPRNRVDAQRMLTLLSDSRHEVHTGVCLMPVDGRPIKSFVETSILKMDPLDDNKIESYLDSRLWEGKAGAFGWQDGNDWLHLEQGSGSNVVGLPLERLARELESFRL